jgi:AcrR family transcriptional regulator
MVSRLPAARRRRQLLDVGLEVFSRKGFHLTSMEEVAEAAGVTKPVLYQHFGSKRELYLELLEDVGGQMMTAVAKAVAGARGPHQQVEAGFAAYFGFVATHEDAFKLLFGGGTRRDEEFADAVARVESTIADELSRLIEADIDGEHRTLLAHGLIGLAEGASRYWLTSGRDVDVDVLSRRVARMAWAGLRGVAPD